MKIIVGAPGPFKEICGRQYYVPAEKVKLKIKFSCEKFKHEFQIASKDIMV
jgi:hypothetical protein